MSKMSKSDFFKPFELFRTLDRSDLDPDLDRPDRPSTGPSTPPRTRISIQKVKNPDPPSKFSPSRTEKVPNDEKSPHENVKNFPFRTFKPHFYTFHNFHIQDRLFTPSQCVFRTSKIPDPAQKTPKRQTFLHFPRF